jgi:gluconolactonase
MRSALALALLLAACDGTAGSRHDDGGVDAAATDGPDVDAGPAVDPLIGIGSVEPVESGYTFGEGPQWFAATGTLRFTDGPNQRIHELAPPDTVTIFRSPSGAANGLGVLPDGRMLACEAGGKRVSVTAGNGDVSTIVDDFEGVGFNSPNDVVARADGTIYFTDPAYGVPDDQRGIDFNGVFRVAAGTQVALAEWRGDTSARPNGIGMSPDQHVLYVDDTDEGVVRAWDIAGDGALSGERTITDQVLGADGMAVDAAGNLYVTSNFGVRVIAPDGHVWGDIEVPEQPSNCAFGGADRKTLYITTQPTLYRVELANPGLY